MLRDQLHQERLSKDLFYDIPAEISVLLHHQILTAIRLVASQMLPELLEHSLVTEVALNGESRKKINCLEGGKK